MHSMMIQEQTKLHRLKNFNLENGKQKMIKSLHQKKVSQTGGDLQGRQNVLSSHQPSISSSNYAQGLSSKARDAVKNVITGAETQSPYRKLSSRPSVSIKIPKKTTLIESKDPITQRLNSKDGGQETDRGYQEAQLHDKDPQKDFLNGSPVETKSGIRTHHRGYSLLNQPVNLSHFDEDQTLSGSARSKKVTAKKTPSNGKNHCVLRKPGTKLDLPDLQFEGYSLQTSLPFTVNDKRTRRHHKAMAQTKRHPQEGRQDLAIVTENKDLSSQNQTSLTRDQKLKSLIHKNENNHDSVAFQTNQSPRVRDNTFKQQEPNATISSNFTKDYPGNLALHNSIGWQPFQTQSMSIQNETMDAFGERTFRTNQQIIAGDSIQSDSHTRIRLEAAMQILATSSVESSIILPSKEVSKNQTLQAQKPTQQESPKRNRAAAAAPSKQPLHGNRNGPTQTSRKPARKPLTINSKSPSPSPATRRTAAKKQLTVEKNAAGSRAVSQAKKHQINDSSAPATRGRDLTRNSRSPSKAGDRTGSDKSKSPSALRFLNRDSKQSAKQKNATNLTSKQFQMRNAAQNANNWHNQSQDKILINSKKQKNAVEKQAPPLTPGIRRFKTQTRDNQQDIQSSEGGANTQHLGGLNKDDNETSSLAEDLSNNQTTKVDLFQAENGTAAKPPIIGLLNDMSHPDELNKFSDAGLKELSIVDSDSSEHVGETPVNRVSGIAANTFNDIAAGSAQIQSPTRSSALGQQSPQVSSNKQQIKVVDTDETPVFRVKSGETNSGTFQDKLAKQIARNAKAKGVPPQTSKVNYLSSNDSAILARSKVAASGVATETLFSTVGKELQGGSQEKPKQKERLETKKQETDYVKYDVDRMHLSINRESDTFLKHRLSNTQGAPIKRSVTNREKQKQNKSSKLLYAPTDSKNASKNRFKPLDTNLSNKRFHKNMPLQGNQRAKQNQVRHMNQFVDSDFFESVSVQRPSVIGGGIHNIGRFGSTSPVSSKASIFMRETSLKNRKSQTDNVTPSKLNNIRLNNNNGTQTSQTSNLELSDLTNPKALGLNQTDSSHLRVQSRKNRHSLEREILRREKKTLQMQKESSKRELSRMYQKKFIERREKQVCLINRQILESSSVQDDSKALAYALSSQYDSAQRVAPITDFNQNKLGLHTLRKVQDSFASTTRPRKQKSKQGYRNNKNRESLEEVANRNLVDYKGTYDSIASAPSAPPADRILQGATFDRRARDYDAVKLLDSEGSSRHAMGQIGNQSDPRLQQQSVVSANQSNHGSQPVDQGIGFNRNEQESATERGGQRVASESSSQFRNAPASQDYASCEKGAAPKGKINLRSASPPQTKDFIQSTMLNRSSQQKHFKVPKMRQPQLWQNVVERKYNMVQTEDSTYFVPGKASKSVHITPHALNTPQNQHQGKNLQRKTDPSHNLADTQETPSAFNDNSEVREFSMQLITANRKKSHELNSIRNQYNTDEDRLKKLTSFSVSRHLQNQRKLQLSGRDDPSNVLGYQKLFMPATMRHSSRKRNQLNPIVAKTTSAQGQGQPSLLDATVAHCGDDKMSTALQQNIQGMLSDLNRAKTMRLASQALKEQQSKMYAIQKRREQISSQGDPIDDSRHRLNRPIGYTLQK